MRQVTEEMRLLLRELEKERGKLAQLELDEEQELGFPLTGAQPPPPPGQPPAQASPGAAMRP